MFLCLLSLEFLIISLILLFMYLLTFFSTNLFIIVISMIFFVCEGVLGLRILVSLIRCFGNDYMSSFRLW